MSALSRQWECMVNESALLMRVGTAGIGNMKVGSRDLKTELKADATFKAPTDLPLPAVTPIPQAPGSLKTICRLGST